MGVSSVTGSVLRRVYYDAPNFWRADAAGITSVTSQKRDPVSDPNEGVRVSDNPRHAELVSSHVKGQPGQHAPLIDLDFQAHLYPSRTPGHSHLWLDRPISWRKYKRLLRALYRAGVIERGFYVMSVKRGASFLRVPLKSGYSTRQCVVVARPDLGDPPPSPRRQTLLEDEPTWG